MSKNAWIISNSEQNKEIIKLLQDNGQHVFLTNQGEEASYEGLEEEIKEFIIQQVKLTKCESFEEYSKAQYEYVDSLKNGEEYDEIDGQESAGIMNAIGYIRGVMQGHDSEAIGHLLEYEFRPISSVDFYGQAYDGIFDAVLENESIRDFLIKLMNNPPENIVGIGLSGSVLDVTDLFFTLRDRIEDTIYTIIPGVRNIPLSLGRDKIIEVIKKEIELEKGKNSYTVSEIKEGIEPREGETEAVLSETILETEKGIGIEGKELPEGETHGDT